MASSELEWASSQFYELDSTDSTVAEETDSTVAEETDSTVADEDEDKDNAIRLDADETDVTRDKFDAFMDADETDVTRDKFDAFMNADETDVTQDKFNGFGRTVTPKIPASEIIVRDIAIERSAPLAALPADTDAAFGQWLAGSRLTPRN